MSLCGVIPLEYDSPVQKTIQPLSKNYMPENK